MAKNETTKDIALPQSSSGEIAADLFARLVGDGFASIETVLLGDPADGKQAMYVGELIGPGQPIEMEPDQKTGEVRTMPTWAFHPMAKTDNGGIGVVRNVTHVIPASYVVHAAVSRIHAQLVPGKTAQVALMFQGQGKTRRGFRLNNFRVFERYVAASPSA